MIRYQMIVRGLYKAADKAMLYTVVSPYYEGDQVEEIHDSIMQQINSFNGELLCYNKDYLDDRDWSSVMNERGEEIYYDDPRNRYLRNINRTTRSIDPELASFLIWRRVNLFELG